MQKETACAGLAQISFKLLH